jgi:hypothetical protein
MSEEISGIFPGAMDKGTIRGWGCQLIFTTNRLIVAKYKRSLLSRMWSNPVYSSHQASPRDRLKMKSVSAQSFLEADPENFEISYSDITVVEYEIIHHKISLKIFMNDLDVPKYRFVLFMRESYKGELKEFLNTVLPCKV